MYNFDEIINRKNTNSLKYDGAVSRGMPQDILPLWVADMDFKAPQEILAALQEATNHGIFGYSEPSSNYFKVLSDWTSHRYNWQPEKEWHLNSPGIVFALVTAINAFTVPGDAVMIQQPVYYPFKTSVVSNHRKLVDNALVLDELSGKYKIDFVDFEQKIKAHNVKIFLLCNPHNPVGRVWTQEELTRMGEICLKYNVVVVSDEIHADFVYDGYTHRVFTSVSDSFLNNSIVCLSPSKTFNLAGLQFSDVFIANKVLRESFKKAYDKSGYSQLNTFGIVAAEAAYRYGAPWLDALIAYLAQNVTLIEDFLRTHIPKIQCVLPEATYLAWLDCRALKLSQKELDTLIVNKANLWLSSGTIFGEQGKGFQRLNFACPRPTLQEALKQLKRIF